MTRETILIIDFGSQYTHLIARRVRELHVYCEVVPPHRAMEAVTALAPKGVILSGGPASVYDPDAPTVPQAFFDVPVPILGVCYGMQLMAHRLGGVVARGEKREFGAATLLIKNPITLFKGFRSRATVWMSHGDAVKKMPPGFEGLAYTENTPIAAMADPLRKRYGVQFHPEVVHTPQGKDLLRNFLFEVCQCRGDWTPAAFVEAQVAAIRARVGTDRVLCGLSGGVDSTVTAVLIHQAIGDQLLCVFVNNGLLRKGEAEQVQATFREQYRIPLRYVDATDTFLALLAGVTDPEHKRRAIGHAFIQIFEEEAKTQGPFKFLAQGTLYPDVIESTATRGPSATIKTHHNVGGLPTRLSFELVEPMRELFKDEVREVGRYLGVPEVLISRHPFPGPGLAVRVLGEVTRERLAILREADAIMEEEIRKAGWYHRVWQAFVVLLPVHSVGVMGDHRTYENVAALRAVSSEDGMTADWVALPYEVLSRIANRIINEVRGINRVVYDVSSKPPATIEWE